MFTKLIRLGVDAELKYTTNGTAVINLNGAYDVGFGQNKKTQWIRCALFGKQAEALAQYLLKGKQIVISADDVHIREYESNGKAGSSLECTIVKLSLVSDGQQNSQQQQNNQQNNYQQQNRQTQQNNQQQSQQAQDNNFDDTMPF